MMDVLVRLIDAADSPDDVAFIEGLVDRGLVCHDCAGLLDDLIAELPDGEAILDRAEELALWPFQCAGEG